MRKHNKNQTIQFSRYPWRDKKKSEATDLAKFYDECLGFYSRVNEIKKYLNKNIQQFAFHMEGNNIFCKKKLKSGRVCDSKQALKALDSLRDIGNRKMVFFQDFYLEPLSSSLRNDQEALRKMITKRDVFYCPSGMTAKEREKYFRKAKRAYCCFTKTAEGYRCAREKPLENDLAVELSLERLGFLKSDFNNDEKENYGLRGILAKNTIKVLIHMLRQQLKVPQKRIADALGVSLRTIKNWNKETKGCSASELLGMLSPAKGDAFHKRIPQNFNEDKYHSWQMKKAGRRKARKEVETK